MLRLTIIIVTYNSADHIGQCLGALREAPPAVPYGVIVVDNASDDDTVAVVKRQFPGVDVLEAESNLGFAKANNLAIRRSSAELILLLNPDTVVRPGAIDRLVAEVDARPEVAVVGPRLVDRDGRTEMSFGAMLSPLTELRQKLLVKESLRGRGPIAAYVQRRSLHPRDVDWVSGACLLVRRTDADAVGLLDERYFMYLEDVDFCAAIRRRGRRVAFVPDAEVMHWRGQSRATAAVATTAAYRRSQVAFYEKHRPRWVRVLRAYLKARGELPDSSITDP